MGIVIQDKKTKIFSFNPRQRYLIQFEIEISKYKRIKKGDLEDEATFTMLRAGFTKASVLHLIILVAFTVFMMVQSKGL